MKLVEHVLGLGLSTEDSLNLLARVSEQEDKPKVLAIDMDDTLLKYVRGGGYGAPLPGMVNLLKQLRADGWKIIIWTCRTNDDRVADKLKEKGIPFDYINKNPLDPDDGKMRKVRADVYLDDKALTANGTGDGLLDKIRAFQSWSKKAREEKKRRKESVDEASTCQNYNHSSGACEDGCVRSGVQMGAHCPWAPDWEKAQKNPDQGGCYCYG